MIVIISMISKTPAEVEEVIKKFVNFIEVRILYKIEIQNQSIPNVISLQNQMSLQI
jgi:hypothetical protein